MIPFWKSFNLQYRQYLTELFQLFLFIYLEKVEKSRLLIYTIFPSGSGLCNYFSNYLKYFFQFKWPLKNG